jgi:serine/threonine-protein kinase
MAKKENTDNKNLSFGQDLKVKVFSTKRSLKNFFNPKGADIYTRFVRRMLLFGILSIFAAALIVIIVLFISRIGAPTTKVPSVRGMNVVEAAMEISSKELAVEIDGKFSDEFGRFMVLEQHPKPGLTVRKGRTVRLLVSLGRDVYTVPDLRGMYRPDAERRLRELNIPFEVTVIQSDAFPTNTIISQDLTPNREVDRSVRMRIVANSDIGRDDYRVPDFTKRPVDYAVRTMYSQGVIPRLNKVITDVREEDGLVITQSARAGSIILKNTAIDINVGVYGEDELERQKYNYHVFRHFIPARPDTEDSEAMANVRITVFDELGEERDIVNKTEKYGSVITVTFKSFGRTRLFLIVDNNFVKEVEYGN